VIKEKGREASTPSGRPFSSKAFRNVTSSVAAFHGASALYTVATTDGRTPTDRLTSTMTLDPSGA
jgi:hypothetical protein